MYNKKRNIPIMIVMV